MPTRQDGAENHDKAYLHYSESGNKRVIFDSFLSQSFLKEVGNIFTVVLLRFKSIRESLKAFENLLKDGNDTGQCFNSSSFFLKLLLDVKT